QAEVAAPHRTRVEWTEAPGPAEHRDRIDDRLEHEHEHETEGPEVLPADHVAVLYGKRDEHLEGAAAPLLGDETHRHDRNHEEAQPDGRELEEPSDARPIELPEAAPE